MRAETARTIPIHGYLEKSGIRPTRSRLGGAELWYHSPIRSDDTNPSFKVNTNKNLWYDHGLAKGGNIIDLVIEQYQCSVSDALYKLERSGVAPNASWTVATSSTTSSAQKSASEKENTSAFQLIEQKPLEHPALLQYLEKRGIGLDVARQHLSEIHFKAPQSNRNYFSLGWPAGNGFEARNAKFKGFVGTRKGVSFLDNENSRSLLVFEGFLDFLSYLTAKRTPVATDKILVLNSTNLWRSSLEHVQNSGLKEVKLFLDNDPAGDEITKQLIETSNCSSIQDMRSHYADHEDLNAWLLTRIIS